MELIIGPGFIAVRVRLDVQKDLCRCCGNRPGIPSHSPMDDGLCEHCRITLITIDPAAPSTSELGLDPGSGE